MYVPGHIGFNWLVFLCIRVAHTWMEWLYEMLFHFSFELQVCRMMRALMNSKYTTHLIITASRIYVCYVL